MLGGAMKKFLAPTFFWGENFRFFSKSWKCRDFRKFWFCRDFRNFRNFRFFKKFWKFYCFPNFILIIHIFFAIRDTDFPDMFEIQTVPGCCSLMVRPSGKVNASKYAGKIPSLLIQVNARPVQSQFPDNPARLLGTPRWLCTCQSAVMFV